MGIIIWGHHGALRGGVKAVEGNQREQEQDIRSRLFLFFEYLLRFFHVMKEQRTKAKQQKDRREAKKAPRCSSKRSTTP